MSAAGDLVAECRRRGVDLQIAQDHIRLYGHAADVRELTPRVQELAVDVLRMLILWTRAQPPPMLAELH